MRRRVEPSSPPPASSCGHGAHVEIEHALALVALFLVLFSELDDLFQNLYVESVAFGLRKHFLLLLAQLEHFGVQIFDPFDERANFAAGNGDVRHGASLINGSAKMPGKK